MRLCHVCAFALVIASGVFAASPVAAQSATEFGVKAGVNFGTITEFADAVGDLGLETGRRTGLVFGGYLSHPLSGNLFIQPEVLLVQKGITVSGGVFEIPVDAKVKLTYLEIPVLFQYRFGSGAAIPYVFAGPALGFNTSARFNTSVFGLGGDEDEDVSDEVRDIETSLLFGGGVMGKWWLGEFRYTEGLSAVNEGGSADFDRDVRNRGISAVFGVRF